MMEMVNTEILMQLWNNWDLRIVMVLSLWFQVFLSIHSLCRLQTKKKWFNYSASLASSFGYWIAGYGLTRMSIHIHTNTSSVPNEVLVMWAPFFLFHLGGANALDSLKVEDEYLWLKKLLYLLPHCSAVIFIIIKSPPNKHLIIATLVVFLLAIIRNGVMIQTQLFQKNEFLNNSYEPQQENLPGEGGILQRFEAFIRNQVRSLDGEVSGVPNLERFPGQPQLIWGGDLYNTFKAFITTRGLSPQLRTLSRSIFTDTTPNLAFSLLASEFYAMYRAFYLTRYAHSFSINFVFKFLFSLIVLWIEKLQYKLARDLEFIEIDLMITDWVLICFVLHELGHWFEELRIISPRYKNSTWSESICGINLVDWCLRTSNPCTKIAKFAAFCRVEDAVDNIRLQFSISVKKMDHISKHMIFHKILERSKFVENKEGAMETGNLRGDRALMNHFMFEQLRSSLPDRNYGEGIILWHIATDLCYATDTMDPINEYSPLIKTCKTISEYMLYLIILEDKIMAPVVGELGSVFKDTCSEARKFFDDNSITGRAEAHRRILSEYNGQRGTSVLYEAIPLAKYLIGCSHDIRWRLMRDVWIELLSYGAFHSTQRIHVEQPGKGGELVSLVWLLMNHLGIGKQFWDEDAARPRYHLD